MSTGSGSQPQSPRSPLAKVHGLFSHKKSPDSQKVTSSAEEDFGPIIPTTSLTTRLETLNRPKGKRPTSWSQCTQKFPETYVGISLGPEGVIRFIKRTYPSFSREVCLKMSEKEVAEGRCVENPKGVFVWVKPPEKLTGRIPYPPDSGWPRGFN